MVGPPANRLPDLCRDGARPRDRPPAGARPHRLSEEEHPLDLAKGSIGIRHHRSFVSIDVVHVLQGSSDHRVRIVADPIRK